MSDIRFVRKHSLTVARARRIAQKAADDLAEEYDLESEWDGDTLNFHRSGVTGSMSVNASQIELEVTLGFLFKPFKAKFESHIAHRLDELLLAAAPDQGAPKSAKASRPAVKPAARKRG